MIPFHVYANLRGPEIGGVYASTNWQARHLALEYFGPLAVVEEASFRPILNPVLG